MNLCDAKQKAFAQRVYFDLKICRKWSKLHVYFDEINKWIFFLGKLNDNQPLTFVLPISSDEQMTVDDLFNLKTKLLSALKFNPEENIQSVLMAIISNDFTLAYFNFTFDLPKQITSDIPTINSPSIDDEFINEIKEKEINDNDWDTNIDWN